MVNNSIYEQNGFKDRIDYLKSVANDFGTDMMVVTGIAEILGENEDLDGLISTLEDLTEI